MKTGRSQSEKWARCPDCNAEYLIGMMHWPFCEAHTCAECGAGYPFIIPKNQAGMRVCVKCASDLYREAQKRAADLEREVRATQAALDHENKKFSRELEYLQRSQRMSQQLEKLEKQLERQKRSNKRLKERLKPKPINGKSRQFNFHD